MAITRDDRWLTDAQGRALAGAQVYYCTQPANTSVLPPTPLATVYTSTSGITPVTQPLITDGFGHADGYLNNGLLYTIVLVHPLFGSNPVVLVDQAIAGTGGGGGAVYTPWGAVPSGTINGSNTVFTLTTNGSTPLPSNPVQASVIKNGLLLTPTLGYTLSGITVTFASAPQIGDTIYAFGLY